MVTSALAPFVAILFPDRRVGPEVAAGRYGWPMLVIVLCAGLAAFAIGARLDLRPEVRAEYAAGEKKAAGDLHPTEVKTDRDIDDIAAERTAVARVKMGLDVGLMTPLRIIALACALLLLGRYVGGEVTMPRAMTAAALVSMPGAVRSLVTAAAAWRQPGIGGAERDQLLSAAALPIPSGQPALAHLLAGVDLFTCWSAVVLVFALAAAARLRPGKALATAAVGLVLYVLVTGAIMGGGLPRPPAPTSSSPGATA